MARIPENKKLTDWKCFVFTEVYFNYVANMSSFPRHFQYLLR